MSKFKCAMCYQPDTKEPEKIGKFLCSPLGWSGPRCQCAHHRRDTPLYWSLVVSKEALSAD